MTVKELAASTIIAGLMTYLGFSFLTMNLAWVTINFSDSAILRFFFLVTWLFVTLFTLGIRAGIRKEKETRN